MTALPSDPGLQPERTELAWRRTALTIAIGSLVALRLLPASLGDPWWALAGVVGLLFASGVWVLGRRRLRAATLVLSGGAEPNRMPGGAALASLGTFVFAVGVTAAVIVLIDRAA
ncbi:DUF202 domain-containing protein [Microbacterium insulae]|uniref:DUF202 domain-containing protein n=1 Tax=Microbacterium insulae TaxID=483014 RepID=A0ABW3AH25_9MICO